MTPTTIASPDLEEAVAARIFEPLGMRDTAFFVPPEKTARFTTTYTAFPDGSLKEGFGCHAGCHAEIDGFWWALTG